MIVVIDSEWCLTRINCKCGGTYVTDGKHRPQCDVCLEPVADEIVWQWLIDNFYNHYVDDITRD